MRAATVGRTDTPATATDDDRASTGVDPVRHPIRTAATTPAMAKPAASRCRRTVRRGSTNARRAHAAMRIPPTACRLLTVAARHSSSGHAGGSSQPSASGRNAVGGVRPRVGRGWIDGAAADNGSGVARLDQRFCTCARQARHHAFRSGRIAWPRRRRAAEKSAGTGRAPTNARHVPASGRGRGRPTTTRGTGGMSPARSGLPRTPFCASDGFAAPCTSARPAAAGNPGPRSRKSSRVVRVKPSKGDSRSERHRGGHAAAPMKWSRPANLRGVAIRSGLPSGRRGDERKLPAPPDRQPL